LDRRGFGELKARARAELGHQRWRAGGAAIGDDERLEILAGCWGSIASDNVKKAWNVV
jgi:hypothetical protein